MEKVKEYRLYQHYPSGNVVIRALSTDQNRIRELKGRLEAKQPTSVYQIQER
jgi:hypothetical protein